MSKYGKKEYQEDLKNPEMLHIKDKERFINFYNELGKEEIQLKQQVAKHRISFIEPVGKIIELGCHCGFNSIYYAKQGFVVIGVDISETLIEEANRRLKATSSEVQERCSFVVSDIEDLEKNHIKKEEKFDTIILTEVLEHCIDPNSLIRVASNLLSESGKIFISAPSVRRGTYSHVRGIDSEYLMSELSKHNLVHKVWQSNGVTYAIASKESL